MIGLDTNVLVRYVVRDDPAQTALADRCVEDACSLGQPGFVMKGGSSRTYYEPGPAFVASLPPLRQIHTS